MKFSLCILVLSLTAIQISVQKSTVQSSFYVAAVVEYSPDIYNVTETDVLIQNAKQYVNLIENASSQDVDIIVFPECGLATLHSSMEHSSVIPDPVDKVTPCNNSSSGIHEAIRILSCAARDNDIYVVVNIPEKKSCSQSSPSNCTTLHYNTDVVFDRQGVIIARYRKYNLFSEGGLNITDTPEISTFTTDFGVTFGIFTCFDIHFEKPAISLVKEYGITDIVFPTAWYSELPFLTAVQVQASWAYGWNVNFLGSGYNHPSGATTGSGIYAGKNGVLKSIMASEPTTELLVEKVPKMTSKSAILTLEHTALKTAVSKSRIGFWKDYLEPYTTKLLYDGTFNESICHGSFCCSFTGKLKKSSSEEYNYRLAAFDGIRKFTYDYKTGGLQVCAVIFCANESLASCVEEIGVPEGFSTSFESIKIRGTFQLENATQLPNTLVPGYSVLPPAYYDFTRQEDQENNLVTIIMETNSSQALPSLLTFGIFGRNFLKDGQPADDGQPPDDGATVTSQSLVALSISMGIAIIW